MGRNPHFRITGGIFKGRVLHAPLDRRTRPMQGALRETVFNVLRPELEGANVLDLFSGTGSLGLEALSRGAASCTFCERHRPAVAVLRKNIEGLGCGEIAEILTVDLLRMRRFPETPHAPFQVVFLDPPFGFMDPGTERDLLPLINLLVEAEAVSAGAVLVHQLRRKQSPVSQLSQFTLEKEKQHGSVRLAFYSFSP